MDEAKTTPIAPAISRTDWLPFAGIMLVLIVLYLPMFLGSPVMPDTLERIEPWNTELGYEGPTDYRIQNSNNDAVLLYIPWNKFAHDELDAGRIPAWDPYTLSGVPLAANHLVPVFYPVYFLIAKYVSPLFIMGVSGFIHTLLMCIFFYLFLREWIGNRTAAFLASCFLAVSMIPNPHYQPWPMTLAFYPAIWFFFERWVKHRSLWSVVWMALCWAVPLMAGYPSLVFQMTIFTFIWILLRPYMGEKIDIPWKSRFFILIVPFILGAGLSGIQNVPTYMASMESDRSFFKSELELQREYALFFNPNEPWQTHVKKILQPAIPFRFAGNDFSNRGHIGLIPVAFALFAIGWYRKNSFPKLIFWLTLICGILATVPQINFYFYLLFAGALIDPNPPLEVYGFLIIFLSGHGFKFLMTEFPVKPDSKNILILLPVILLLIATSLVIVIAHEDLPNLLNKYYSIIVVYLNFVMGVVGIISVFAWFQIEKKKITKIPKVFAWFPLIIILFFIMWNTQHVRLDLILKSNREPYLITNDISQIVDLTDSSQPSWGRIIRYTPEPFNVMSVENQPYLFYPNLGTYFEIPDSFGYHNLAPALRFNQLRDIQRDAVIENRGIVSFTGNIDFKSLRTRLPGARYILTDTTLDDLPLVLESDAFNVYEIPDALPRAFNTSDSGNLAEISDAEIVLDDPGHAIIRSNSNNGKVLFFNEGYANGWTAEVGRGEVPITESHGIMMVGLGEGEGVVEFKYRMPGLAEGILIATLSFLLTAIFGIAAIVIRK